MKRWFAFPSVRIALCVAAFGVLAWWAGPFATVIASPLLAVAIARPAVTLLSNLRHGVRAVTWLPVHGHHYVFKGVTMRVLEDDDRKVAAITGAGSDPPPALLPMRHSPLPDRAAGTGGFPELSGDPAEYECG